MDYYQLAVKQRTAWLKSKYKIDGRKARSMTIHDFKTSPALLEYYERLVKVRVNK